MVLYKNINGNEFPNKYRLKPGVFDGKLIVSYEYNCIFVLHKLAFNMKKIFFFCIAFVTALAANCQDIIIKKTGEEIKAKVLEIGVSEVKYKRFDFQDGPVYTIAKTEVIMVRYENGINEVISTTTPTPPAPSNNQTSVPPPSQPEQVSNKIESAMGSYRQNGRYISKTRVISTLKATNDPEIMKLLRKSSNKKTTGTVVALGLGLPLIIVGAITTLRGVVITNDQSTYSTSVDPDGPGITTVGAVMVGSGIALQFVNIGLQVRANNLIEDAILVYNNRYADQPAK